MQRLLPCFLMLVIAPSVAAVAEDESGRLLADLDSNHDGVLSRKEAGKANGLLFDRLLRTSDDDGDGRLTAEEFAAGLQPVRAEKPLVEKQGGRIPGSDALLVLLAKMDVNRDQQIVAKEVPGPYRAAFDRMLEAGDDDSDGKLNSREIARKSPQLGVVAGMSARQMGIDVPAELAKLPKAEVMAMDQMDAYGRPEQMMADPAMADELFARIDADGDGKVSAQEAPPQMAERFNQMLQRGDRDGDSQLSAAEFKAMSKRMAEFQSMEVDPKAVNRTVRQMLSNFDTDGDGQLSRQEAPRRLAANFERADQDANDSLDSDELRRAAETMQKLQKQMGGPRQGGFGPPDMAAKQPGRGKQRPAADAPGAGKRSKKPKK